MINGETKTVGSVGSRAVIALAVLVVFAGFATESPENGLAGDEHGLECSFTASSGTLLITGRGDGVIEVNNGTIALVQRGGLFESDRPVVCHNSDPPYEQTTPTVFDTDAVAVDAVGEFRSEAGLQPGLSAENGAPEIELVVADSVTGLAVDAGESATEVVLGSTAGGGSGINLNAADESEAESDVDVIFEGDPPAPLGGRGAFPNVSVSADYGSPTPRTFTAAGGAGFTGPFPTGVELRTGTGDDLLVAGLGKSRLDSGVGTDILEGGPGGDALSACGERSEAYGRGGDDKIGFGILTAVVDGGAGSNWAQFFCRPDAPLQLDLSNHEPQDLGQGAALRMVGISNVEAGYWDDVVRGDDTANRIYGFPGDDRLYGGGGNDKLIAEQGRDHLVGGSGSDDLDGSFGVDTLVARDGHRDSTIDCGPADNTLERAVVDRRDPRAISC